MNYKSATIDHDATPAPIQNFAELEADRKRLIAALLDLKEAFGKVDDVMHRQGCHRTSSLDEAVRYRHNRDMDFSKLMKDFDIALWQKAISSSGVDALVTASDAKQMRDKLEEEPPVFRAADAEDMVTKLIASRDNLAMNSVKQVFERLTEAVFRRGGSTSWKAEKRPVNTHKLESSFRMSLFWGGLPEYWYGNDHAAAVFDDLELACCIVGEKTRPVYPNRLSDRIAKERREAKTLNFITPWFTVQLFLNGNVKIDFTDLKVLDRLNAWGSDGTKLPRAE